MLGLPRRDLPLLFAAGWPRRGRDRCSRSTSCRSLPIPILFYFLIIRPQQQQEQKRQAMIDALKKNDKVADDGGDLRHGDLGRPGPRTGSSCASTTTKGVKVTFTAVERGAGARDRRPGARPRAESA